MYRIVLPRLMAFYHCDTHEPLLQPRPTLMAHLPQLWWVVGRMLDYAVHSKITLPFFTSFPFAWAHLLCSLPVLFTCLNNCTSSRIPFGYHLCRGNFQDHFSFPALSLSTELEFSLCSHSSLDITESEDAVHCIETKCLDFCLHLDSMLLNP